MSLSELKKYVKFLPEEIKGKFTHNEFKYENLEKTKKSVK